MFADLGLDVGFCPVVVQEGVNVVKLAVDELARGWANVVLVEGRNIAVKFGVCDFAIGASEERPRPLSCAMSDKSVLIGSELPAVGCCELVWFALSKSCTIVSTYSWKL